VDVKVRCALALLRILLVGALTPEDRCDASGGVVIEDLRDGVALVGSHHQWLLSRCSRDRCEQFGIVLKLVLVGCENVDGQGQLGVVVQAVWVRNPCQTLMNLPWVYARVPASRSRL
jgi:hypothetical protein